jgi:hypothetical protein
MKLNIFTIIVGGMLLSMSSCTVLSTFQSAKTLGKGNSEITGNFTSYSYSVGEGAGSETYKSFGAQGAYGVSDKLDAGIRLERMTYKTEVPGSGSETSGANFLSFSGKYSLIENKLSAYVPLGMYFGEDVEVGQTLNLRPTLLGNFDVSKTLELTPMVGYYLPFDSEAYSYFQLGVGAGFRPASTEGLCIRPELGYSINSDVNVLHFGLGAVYQFGSK